LLPHPSMATRLFCCVALCLLGLEHADAGVAQTPRHKVTKMGQAVRLNCEPISGHYDLYWYRQTSLQELKFLIYFNNGAPIDNSGMPKDRFSAKMPNGSFSTLNIQPTEPGDSAVYLCASSLATTLKILIYNEKKRAKEEQYRVVKAKETTGISHQKKPMCWGHIQDSSSVDLL
ncbi:T-cell receptor beta chain V region YT35, partial [Myotis brandtii]